MARRSATMERAEVPQVGGGWWMVHGLPLFTPPLLALVWAGVVQAAHAAWGGDPYVTPLLAIVMLLLGAVITGFGWVTAGPRKHLKVAVTASGSAATVNLVLGLVFGLGQMWLISVYVICTVVVSALWAIWRGAKFAGATTRHGDPTGTSPLMAMVDQARVQFSKPVMDDRGVVRATVRTLDGGTMDDAQALVGPLSAAARAVPGGANMVRHPNVDGVGRIEIPTRDNLKHGVPWPGLTRLGTLPTEPFAIGEYQSGPCMVRIVGDASKDRNAQDISHVKIGGVTGSGKSTGAQVFLGSQMAMRRLNIIGVDLSAELQILGPLAKGLTWVISDVDEARLFMERMKIVVRGSKAHLAREGLKRWSPASSLNLLEIWIEESKEFGRFASAYHSLVADARAAGIWIVSSTQNWIYRTVSTDVRKQHPSGICFGMTEADDVAHVLPDEAIAALGKDRLPTWGDKKPGYCYAAGLGIAPQNWPRMLRMYDPLEEQLVQAVEVGAPYRDEMDPVRAELFGELFEQRTRYDSAVWGSGRAAGIAAAPERPARRPSVSIPRDHPGRFVPASRGAFDDDEDPALAEDAEAEVSEEYAQDHQRMLSELEERRLRLLGEDATDADFEDVDPEQPIDTQVPADLDDAEEEDDQPNLSPAEAQRLWDQKLDELYRSGCTQLETSQASEWLSDVGRERTFLYRQIERWERKGCVARRPDADGWDVIASPLEDAIV